MDDLISDWWRPAMINVKYRIYYGLRRPGVEDNLHKLSTNFPPPYTGWFAFFGHVSQFQSSCKISKEIKVDLPIQPRGPPPKGIYDPDTILLLLISVNLSGSNSSGLGKNRSSV